MYMTYFEISVKYLIYMTHYRCEISYWKHLKDHWQ